jgi:hypothetical protein
MGEGHLKKLKIIGYEDAKFSESKKVQEGEFTTLVNPEKYNLKYNIEYNDKNAPGTSSGPAKFVKMEPQDFEIEFLFDSTGVIPAKSEDSVQEEIDKFRKIVFDYNGEKHRPNFIKIIWGALLFKGVFVSLDLEYKLFKPNGDPIRAVAKCSFKGHQDDEERAADENKNSPDLTHVRQVKGGDTLPLMTHRIYGDSKYYLEVAKFNKLSNFRKLTPGQQIVFPPIDKKS